MFKKILLYAILAIAVGFSMDNLITTAGELAILLIPGASAIGVTFVYLHFSKTTNYKFAWSNPLIYVMSASMVVVMNGSIEILKQLKV